MVTTLSGSNAVNALTTTEATQLCDDTYAYFGSAIPRATACKWKGLSYAASSSPPTDARLQSNCTSTETSCLSAGSTTNPGCSDIPSTCTATVAEYSACISDEVAAFIPAVSGLADCATATKTDMTAVWDILGGGVKPPASCASLTDKCPEMNIPSPSQ